MGNQQEQWNQLAFRLKAGDQKAAEELIENYSKSIYLFFRRLGHTRQTSEDLTQDTFFQAWQHIGQLRSHILLKSWLYRIASNISKSHWRNRQNEIQTGFDPAESFQISEQLENSEQLGHLKKIVENLPIKFKEVIILHYMQNLTIKEASDALGIWQGTYKSRLNRALKLIKNNFNHEIK